MTNLLCYLTAHNQSPQNAGNSNLTRTVVRFYSLTHFDYETIPIANPFRLLSHNLRTDF